MTRTDYWVYVVLSLLAIFCIYFVVSATGNIMPLGIDAIIQWAWIIMMWMIGYQRCQDAGVHGGWALFAPLSIGMIWIGCLRSKVTI